MLPQFRKSAMFVLLFLFSRRVRESRTELRKFMREVKKQNPAANVTLQYDKLFVNHRCYVWSDMQGQVVEHVVGDTEQVPTKHS